LTNCSRNLDELGLFPRLDGSTLKRSISKIQQYRIHTYLSIYIYCIYYIYIHFNLHLEEMHIIIYIYTLYIINYMIYITCIIKELRCTSHRCQHRKCIIYVIIWFNPQIAVIHPSNSLRNCCFKSPSNRVFRRHFLNGW
jgi:hypothetical protein